MFSLALAAKIENFLSKISKRKTSERKQARREKGFCFDVIYGHLFSSLFYFFLHDVFSHSVVIVFMLNLAVSSSEMMIDFETQQFLWRNRL